MSYRSDYKYVFGNYKFKGTDGSEGFTKWRRFLPEELPAEIVEKSKNGNAFSSIQAYTGKEPKEGELHYCDLYFDLDGPFEKTRGDAVKIVNYFTCERFGLAPELVRVWYSGGKGFHILINAEAIGCEPHKELTYIHKRAALFIEKYTGMSTLDSKSIYSIKRMWRIPDSRHHSGKYKTELYHAELFDKSEDEIKQIAAAPRGALWSDEDLTDITVDEDLNAWYRGFITEYEEDLKFRAEQPGAAIRKVDKEPACVRDLLDNHIRQAGSRNKATLTLATYYKDQGYSLADAEKIIVPWACSTPREFTSQKGKRELTAGTKSTIKSVFDAPDKYVFGCGFIRTLGTGTDKPIACSGNDCSVINVSLEDQIFALPENINFQEHAESFREIYREMAMKGPTAREHYINLLRDRFKLSKTAIRDEIKQVEMLIKIEPSIPKPLDRPRDKELSLAQDIKEGIFRYLIYVSTNKGSFVPRLVTSEHQLENIEDDEGLPEDMARWSVDRATEYNVFEFLGGTKKVEIRELYDELEGFLRSYMWYPDERYYKLVAVWIMQTYVFQVCDTVGYLALIGTKRTGKSRTLEILEQFAFNASKADSMSDAYIYRVIERNRATLLFDEADSLRKAPDKSINERLEIIRSGYKRAGKVGRCEGETNSTVTFSTYSPKAIANVTGLEDALEDRVIYVNVERKPQEVKIKKLIFRDLERVIQTIRNKLYFFGLQYAAQIAEVYREYANSELEDREAEIWTGILVIAQIIGTCLHDDLLALAVENRDRKELHEGLESTEAQVIMTIWNLVQEGEYSHMTYLGKYWSADAIKGAAQDQLGWEKMSHRFIPSMLIRLRIIEDTEEYKRRFVFDSEKGRKIKKICYLLNPERIKMAAKKYSVCLEGAAENEGENEINQTNVRGEKFPESGKILTDIGEYWE